MPSYNERWMRLVEEFLLAAEHLQEVRNRAADLGLIELVLLTDMVVIDMTATLRDSGLPDEVREATIERLFKEMVERVRPAAVEPPTPPPGL